MRWPLPDGLESGAVGGLPLRITFFDPAADSLGLFTALSAPEIWTHIPGGPPHSKSQLALRLATSPVAGGKRHAVTVRWGSDIVGTSSFVIDPAETAGLEIDGTYLAPEVWGTGVNSAVKQAMCRAAFDAGAEWVLFRTDERNFSSAAAIRKLPGVVQTGVVREPTIVRSDGTIRRSLMFRVFRTSLSDIEHQLRRREPLFHHRALGTTRADFLAQTADDFWEVGASGRRYEREEVWAVLNERFATDDTEGWIVDEFRIRSLGIRPLGGDVYLVTYRLLQDGHRVTRRSTLWESIGTGWRAIYHQGTLAGP